MENTRTNNLRNNSDPYEERKMRRKRFEDMLSASQSQCYKLLQEYDDAMIKGWKEEIDTLLVFVSHRIYSSYSVDSNVPLKAGLFSAVVTAFSVQSYPALKSNPMDPSVEILTRISAQLGSFQINGQTITSTQPTAQYQATTPSVPTPLILVNALWFTSLIFSLVAASIGILLKQWLREYGNDMKDAAEDNLRIRQLRYESLVRWRVKEIVMLLPLLLQIALIMFLIGLMQLAWTLNFAIAVIVTTFVSVALAFTSVTMFLPAVAPTCPYKSPQARLFFHFWRWMQSSFRAIFKVVYKFAFILPRAVQESLIPLSFGYPPLHNWIERENLYIQQLWFTLDVHILRAVKTAYTTTFRKFPTIAGPIAVNALGRKWLELGNASDCPSDELAANWLGLKLGFAREESAACLDEYLSLTATHCGSQHSSIPVQQELLSSLANLLKWDFDSRFQGMSWHIISRYAHRFETDISRVELTAVIDFVKNRVRRASLPSASSSFGAIDFIDDSVVVIKLSTLISNDEFDGIRDKLAGLLQLLSSHVRDISRPMVTRMTWVWAVLELAQKHVDVVTDDLVRAFEERLRCMEEIPNSKFRWADPATIASKKHEFRETLHAIRKLMNGQHTEGPPSHQMLSS